MRLVGEMTRSVPRMLLITNIPTPYRIPLFNELNRQLSDEGYSLKVIFGALEYTRRKWEINLEECKFEYLVLPSRAIRLGNSESAIFTYSGLNRLLAKERPVAVLTNAFSLATTKLWLRNRIKRTPYVIWSGAIESKNRPISRYRIMQRKVLVRGAAGYVTYGTRAKEYLVSLGAEEDSIHIGINTVDTEFFWREANAWRDKRKCSDMSRLLYVGNLSQGKRLDLLLHAIKVLSEHRKDFVLYLVGDGPERRSLETLTKRLNIGPFVRFEGFRQKSEIPRYLAQSCCFLFPSEYDIWGLVLNEAMASAVPCIASVYAGATRDLIEDGKTGFAMDFSNPSAIADRIQWILDHPEQAKTIGHVARNFIEQHATLCDSAQGFVKALLLSRERGS